MKNCLILLEEFTNHSECSSWLIFIDIKREFHTTHLRGKLTKVNNATWLIFIDIKRKFHTTYLREKLTKVNYATWLIFYINRIFHTMYFREKSTKVNDASWFWHGQGSSCFILPTALCIFCFIIAQKHKVLWTMLTGHFWYKYPSPNLVSNWWKCLSKSSK